MHLLIYSLDSYSLFNPSTNFIFGGAEIRASYFAKGLSELSKFEVSIITRNQGRKMELLNGISLYPHPTIFGEGYWNKRKSIFERVKMRLVGSHSSGQNNLDELIAHINPDVVITLGMSNEAAALCKLVRSRGKKFVFGVTSDIDLEYNPEKHPPIDLFKSLYENSDLVLVQTFKQQVFLKEKYNLSTQLLMNPVHDYDFSNNETTLADVLWVGKSSVNKRPEFFLDLAASLPQFSFRMILNKTNVKFYNFCLSSKTENVEIVPHVPFHQISNYFKASKVFVSTSLYEGFPNTFLQSALYGLPIISMRINPNEMLTTHGCGVLSGDDRGKLRDATLTMLNEKKQLEVMGENAKKYISKFHDYRTIIFQLENLLRELVKY